MGFLTDALACPRHQSSVAQTGDQLRCELGCRFPVVDGVPVMLLEEENQTIGIAEASLAAAKERTGAPLYLDTLGLSDDEKRGIARDYLPEEEIDAVISYLIGATSGFGYLNLIGKLGAYPIPSIPFGQGDGRLLLDVGCNWGRWTISASRKGWRAIGLDPSLGAIMAAKRAFPNDRNISFVCGDARFLPFRAAVFDAAFSYSVLQHFSEEDAASALAQMGRVLSRNGCAKVQMAHAGGLRSAYIRTRKDYLNGGVFRVRYWGLNELRNAFERAIGPTKMRAEAFGGLGLLWEDLPIVSMNAKCLIVVSELVKRASGLFPPLIKIADSVYVGAAKK